VIVISYYVVIINHNQTILSPETRKLRK